MSTVASSFGTLNTLVSLITSSLSTLESTCTTLDTPWPPLDTPTYASRSPPGHSPDVERAKNEVVARASATIVAAATHLIAAVAEPGMTVLRTGLYFHLSSALRIAAELHVADILRDAGDEGLHVNEIAKKVKVDPTKLARILRLLATHHIFIELRPNIFTNNRVSAAMEKGQSVDALISNPSGKYDKPESAFAALLCHFGDEVFKSSAHLFESLAKPETAFSGSPSECAWALSQDLMHDLGTPLERATTAPPAPTPPEGSTSIVDKEPDLSGTTMWELFARPTPPATYLGFETERLRRFGVAMESTGRIGSIDEVFKGFDFASLPQSSVIVDVGGGVGTVARLLTTKFDNVNVIVQDREEVVEEGIKRWKETSPELLENGRVTFKAQSFFSPQPQSDGPKPAAYLLKSILHDWSDAYCHTILKHLRKAVTVDDGTRLLVMDSIASSATTERGGDASENEDEEAKARREVAGIYQERAKAPLLGNWGAAGATPYFADVIMLTVMNGQERTLSHARTLFRGAGWDIVKVTQTRTIGQVFALIESKPI